MISSSQNMSDEQINVSNNIIEYPSLDFSIGIGFMWLTQANLTLSAFRYFYLQPRLSYSFVAIERGLTVGYQNQVFEDTILRFGIGYSKGRLTPIHRMGTNYDEDYWEGIYIRSGVVKKINSGSILNVNINIIPDRKPMILSININYVFVLI
jgi:hypothetical protein